MDSTLIQKIDMDGWTFQYLQYDIVAKHRLQMPNVYKLALDDE